MLSDSVLLPNLYVNKEGQLSVVPYTNVVTSDVTGGMKLKMQSATNIVANSEGNSVVHVCDIMSAEFESLCLTGQATGDQWTTVQIASS